MPANTKPIFPLIPNISITNIINTANISRTGEGSQVVFTASANGSYVDEISAISLGNNDYAILRLFINNQLYREFNLESSAASETSIQPLFLRRLDLTLPATYTLSVAISIMSLTPDGWSVTVTGGDY